MTLLPLSSNFPTFYCIPNVALLVYNKKKKKDTCSKIYKSSASSIRCLIFEVLDLRGEEWNVEAAHHQVRMHYDRPRWALKASHATPHGSVQVCNHYMKEAYILAYDNLT